VRQKASIFGAVEVLAAFLTGCGGGSVSPPPPRVVLQTITVTPANAAIGLGTTRQYSAVGHYSDASTQDLTASANWVSTDPAVANVDHTGILTTKTTGTTNIQAVVSPVTGSASLTVVVPPHSLLKNAGLYVQFERRGWPTEYWSGEVIQNWDQFDSTVGSTVSSEVSLQLDQLKAMGVNTISFELRAADLTLSVFQPPACNIDPVLGLQFPQPSAAELANLPRFLDMVQSKGMKIWLQLVNTHMEEQPPTNSQTWLGAIFNAIGTHPAIDLILFAGSSHLNADGTCGIPAEPPLWLGPGSVPANYVQWAMNFAMAQGMSSSKLAAEVVVGSFLLESNPPAGLDATGGHLWSPITVEKGIFDNLGIPQNQRTYALSLYEHRKCSDAQNLPCTDLDPHDWADQTLQYNMGVVGGGARVVASEIGDLTPIEQSTWNTEHALESLVFLLQKHGIDGGIFWRWVSSSNSEDSDPTLATPVKKRGASFNYHPVQKEVRDMAGTHVTQIANGSFEGAVNGRGVPANWSAAGNGTASRYLLTQEPGQPEVPSRGSYALRIVTGNNPDDTVTATSATIAVAPFSLLTTTFNLRFSWTGDPNPTGAPDSRPHVFVSIAYLQSNGVPSAIRTEDTFSYFQEDSTTGFATFPVQYITPADAALIQIQCGAIRNGLPLPITFDVDNVR
jgi:hypothetical protein